MLCLQETDQIEGKRLYVFLIFSVAWFIIHCIGCATCRSALRAADPIMWRRSNSSNCWCFLFFNLSFSSFPLHQDSITIYVYLYFISIHEIRTFSTFHVTIFFLSCCISFHLLSRYCLFYGFQTSVCIVVVIYIFPLL